MKVAGLPSMLMAMVLLANTPVNAEPVNCEPRSVLNISGFTAFSAAMLVMMISDGKARLKMGDA